MRLSLFILHIIIRIIGIKNFNIKGMKQMPTIAYFGNRFLSFSMALGIKKLIWVTNSLPESEADIVVIDTPFEKALKLPKGVIGVCFSDNDNGLACLKRSGVKTVTCGTSCQDTVTLSSSVPKILVCLNKSLITLTGKVFEPAEFLVNETYDYDCLLLASATRLLCGLEPK